MKYAVVIEKAEGNYSAYVPDLPVPVLAVDRDFEAIASCTGLQGVKLQ